jgi:hypothetical protein
MFSGYLVKIKGIPDSETVSSDYTVPLRVFEWASYKATRSTMDKDSRRNGKARLKRKTYPHRVCHCSFTFRSMTAEELWPVWKAMRDRYVKVRQKKVKASIWVPEINDYVEDYFYMPDIEFTIMKVEPDGSSVKYNPIECELIGY